MYGVHVCMQGLLLVNKRRLEAALARALKLSAGIGLIGPNGVDLGGDDDDKARRRGGNDAHPLHEKMQKVSVHARYP